MKNLIKLLPGLLLAITIGITAKHLTPLVPSLGAVTIAIILGILIGNLLKLGTHFQSGIQFTEKKVLALAIMLLGLDLNLLVFNELGIQTLIYIVLIVGLTVVSGYFIGKLLGLTSTFSLLLGVGNGICGSSAVAAAAPLLKAKEEETGLSISVVNLLGTIGIFLLPLIISLINFVEPLFSGVLVGGTLQAVGHVTAAGFAMGDEVGKIATVVKMGRILMLGPVLLVLGFFFGEVKEKSDGKKGIAFPIPPFIIGFFIFSLIASLQILPIQILTLLKWLSKEALIVAMAGIGLKINFASLLKQGPKALLVGILIFAVQIISSILIILTLY